jgi:predicted kinase
MLILLRGQPGTGKSTVADALGKRLCAAIIDKDDVKDVMDAKYRDEFIGGLCYEVMLRMADRCLAAGSHVICDSSLTYPDLHERALAIAARHDVPAHVIHLRCSDVEEWRGRIERRQELGMPAHRVKEFSSQHIIKSALYNLDDEIAVDTAQPLDSVIEEILSRIS